MASTSQIVDVDFQVKVEPPDSGPVSASFQSMGAAADAASAQFSAFKQASVALGDALGKASGNAPVIDASWRRLSSSLDPYSAALQRANAEQAKLNALIAAGRGDAEQYSRLQTIAAANITSAQKALEQHNKTLGEGEGATRRVQFAMRDLGLQSIDMFQGIATGQSVLRTFIQQGSQIVQVNAAMGVGFGAMAKALAGLITPTTLAVGGIAAFSAAVVGLTVFAESNARRLGELRLAFSGARDDYAAMATTFDEASRKASATLTSSAEDISKAQKIIIQQGHFQGTADELVKVTEQAEALGKVMGTDLPTAMKLYATAVTDPLAAIKQIAGSPELLRQVSTATLGLAKAQAEVGDRARATQLITNDLNKAWQAQRDQLTPLQRELKDTDEAFKGIVNSIRDLGLSFGDFLKSQVVEAVQGIKEFIDLIKQIPALIPHSGVSSGPALTTREPGTVIGTPLIPGPYASQLNAAVASTGQFGQSLYQALIAAESSGNQFTSQGRVLLPGGGGLPLGAVPGYRQPVGIGQITPETASGYGYSAQDLTTVQGNIGASSAYFKHIYQKYNGDPTLVVAAYNMGEPALDALLRRPANEQQFPIETQREIGKVLGTLYGAGVTAPGSASAASAAASTGRDLGRGQFGPEDNEGARRAIAGDFGAGTAKQIAEVRSQLKDAEDAFHSFEETLGGNDKVTKEYAARVANLREQLNNLLDPTREGIRASLQSADVTRLLGEADQKLLEKRQEIARYNEAHRNAMIDDTQATRALSAVQKELDAQYDRGQATLNRDISNRQKQLDVYRQGPRAVSDAVIAQQAYAETLKTTSESDARFAERLAETTEKLKQRKDLDNQFAISDMSKQLQDQTEVLNLEIRTLGEDNNTRSVAIDLLRTEQQLRADSRGFSDQQIQGYLAEKKALDELNLTLQGRQRDMDFIAGEFSSAFDTIGNAITQAFVQGEGQAVNFGNVMKGVASTIIQSFLKLAVINPILNGLFGQNNSTLFSVADTINSQGGFLSRGIFGTSTAEQQNLVYSDLIREGGGLSNPLGTGSTTSLAPTGILGGASIGSVALGTLGGFSLGSVAGGITQRALNKTGPGPQIGAGAGALAGAAIGSIIPGIGTVVGGLIGGVIGGAGGGFIGPRPPSPYAATFVGIGPNGELTVSPSLTGHQITDSNFADIQNQATQFNQAQQQLGVRIIGTASAPKAGAAGGLGFFGTATNLAGIQGQNIQDAFSNIRFGAAAGTAPETAQVLDRYINAKAFSSFDQLGQAVNKVKGFVEQTVPALLKMGSAAGSLQDAIDNINNQFTPAIATAKELGYQEQALTEARDKAIAAAQRAADEQFATLPEQYLSREATAGAALSNDPNQILAAQQRAFDVQANAERKQLRDSLVSTYGEAVQQSQLYADLSLDLEKALGAERLAIQKQSNDAISNNSKQAAAELLTSIADYTRGLTFSAASPLSPQAQLEAARSQFNAVSGAAAAGDANSISKLTNYSDTLLNAARAVYGSGEGYVQVFTQVTDALNRVAAVSPDTLTASIFALETRAQTDTLVAALTSLQNEVAGLKAQLNSNAAMPSRLAA